MAQALDIFADSYFRKLKRPELFNFNPDDAYGANSVFGSNEQNPWANRNQANAKFGQLGGTSGTGNIAKIASTPMGNFGQLGPTGNMPQAQSTFSTLLGNVMKPLEKMGGDYVTSNALSKLQELFSSKAIEPGVREATGTALTHMLSGTTPASASEVAIGQALMGEGGASGVEKAVESFGSKAAQEGIEAGVSGAEKAAESGVPVVGPALGIAKDLITGKLIKDPIGSLATTGGGMAGAAVGSMILPGPGTIIGGVLGSTLGSLFGGGKKKKPKATVPLTLGEPSVSPGGLSPTQEQYLSQDTSAQYENPEWNDWLAGLFNYGNEY